MKQRLQVETVIVVVLASLVTQRLYRLYQSRKNNGLPPGPRGLPFVGAFFHLLQEDESATCAAWKSRYGDIVGLQTFGHNLVILNTSELSIELLNKRARFYSNRPHIPMLELCVFFMFSSFSKLTFCISAGISEWNLGIMASSDEQRIGRQLFVTSFTPSKVTQYLSIQRAEIINLLRGLSLTPGRFAWHLRRYVTEYKLLNLPKHIILILLWRTEPV